MPNPQKMMKTQSFDSVWDALADTPAEAENLKIRSALISQISDYIHRKNLTPVGAAKMCQVTQPRMNDLMQGKLSKFSLDALINMAASAGLHISIELKEEEFI